MSTLDDMWRRTLESRQAAAVGRAQPATMAPSIDDLAARTLPQGPSAPIVIDPLPPSPPVQSAPSAPVPVAAPAPAKPSIRDEIRATLADPQAHRLLGAGYGKAGGPGAAALPQPPLPVESDAPAAAPAAVDPKTVKFATPPMGGSPGTPGTEAPTINWGGGGGATTVAAHEQAVVAPGRQAELLGAIDAEGKAIGSQQDAAAGTAAAVAEVERQKGIGTLGVAKTMEDAGVDTKLRAQAQADESKAFRKHIDAFGAKLAKDEIDPQRMYHNATTGQNITWTIAKAMGAMGQALLHQSTNQVADSIDAMAAQDVAAQRANHEMGREHLADMKTAYAEALRATGDKEQAERVAQGYVIEAAKLNAAALTENAQSDVQKKRGAELVAALSERQALVGEKRAETGIKLNPYVQARTVGGAEAPPTMKEIGTIADSYVKEQAGLGNRVTPDEALRYAIKIRTSRDPLGPAGVAVPYAGGAKAEKGDKKEMQASVDEVNHGYSNLLKDPVLDKLGFLPYVAAATGAQRTMPESAAVGPELTQFNLAMDSYAGKLLKDNEGRIPPAIVDQLHKFHIKEGDSKPYAQAQIRASQAYVNGLARTAGVTAPEPNAPPAPVVSSFQK